MGWTNDALCTCKWLRMSRTHHPALLTDVEADHRQQQQEQLLCAQAAGITPHHSQLVDCLLVLRLFLHGGYMSMQEQEQRQQASCQPRRAEQVQC